MSFVSWQYAFLLAGVFLLYWRWPWRARIYLLLAGSYFFYGNWDARFLALILKSTVVDYLCGLAIAGQRPRHGQVLLLGSLPVVWLIGYSLLPIKTAAIAGWILLVAALFPFLLVAAYHWLWSLSQAKRPRGFLLLSLVTNLGILGFFKYFNFFADSAVVLLGDFGWQGHWTLLQIILPVGISFYTFQSISYTVDVYRGQTQPTNDFVTFATYLAFFPQLVAGPIERSTHLLPQLEKPAAWDTAGFHHGLRLILMGWFKKVFVADNCALLANYAFDAKTILDAGWAVLGVLAFACQIYGDFSGYSDMARGSAQLLGIQLSRNFSFPYFARGPSEFWQRWHITLSSWFRDYVYIPLGGNRRGNLITLRNLGITMLLAGLWHGANWTFVVWGAYYGILLILYRAVPGLKRLEESGGGWRTGLGISLMFVLTLVGWAFFRSQSLEQLAGWFIALGQWRVSGALDWTLPFCWWLFHVTPLLFIQAATWKARDEVEFPPGPWPVRGLVYALLFLMVASSAVNDQEFIYFQF